MELEMMRERKAYRFWYTILTPFFRAFYWIRPMGRGNIPAGAAVVCANHSSWIDPVLIAVAFGRENTIHMMAKRELFNYIILKGFLKVVGMFPVHREKKDIKAVKTAMKYLTSGEKVGIFPEGTRRHRDNEVDAKTGAVRIAEKTNVPIVPVYIPRRKNMMTPFDVIIGTPYFVNADGRKMSAEDFEEAAKELMNRIGSLNPAGQEKENHEDPHR